MTTAPPVVALLYDDDAYVETTERPRGQFEGRPVGLMGRQVAGREFLDAYLSYGAWKELVALTTDEAATQSLFGFCRDHPSSRTRQRVLHPYEVRRFHESFFPEPPASVLHFPCPPDAGYAWARQHGGPGSFCLSGVTHTLCSPEMVSALCQMVTAPFEPFDTLICTSQAVVDMVRAVTSNYAAYLRDRFGGSPSLRIQLEKIPLGVDPNKFRPATPEERLAKRRELNIADKEIAVLFVGRLSHHAKAHPFPMYHALSRAADAAGKKVHLVMAGWAANAQVLRAFESGVRSFAPNVRVSMIDGTKPEHRYSVWQAADVFTSLSDNIQETFGLVIVEAMACGLPVVASDWNGYRDLVNNGEDGYLVPTWMVRGATVDSSSRALLGEINYDHFLAETSQCVAVDHAAAADAFTRLFRDAALRARLGQSGRQNVLERFCWQTIIQQYEDLWARQEQERQRFLKHTGNRPSRPPGPAIYPSPEVSFAGYPTSRAEASQTVEAVPCNEERMSSLLSMPLTNHQSHRRISERALIDRILSDAKQPVTINRLCENFRQTETTRTAILATVAWMLKYDLLRPVGNQAGQPTETA